MRTLVARGAGGGLQARRRLDALARHRLVQAELDHRLHHGRPLLQGMINLRLLRCIKPPQHISGDGHVGVGWPADTDLEARKLGAAPVALDDAAQAVVSAVGTFLPETQLAQRKVQVVMQHDGSAHWDLVVGAHCLHCVPAEVHEGGGLGQHHPGSAQLANAQHGLELPRLCVQRDACRLRQAVHQREAHVVAGAVIGAARVAQPHHQPGASARLDGRSCCRARGGSLTLQTKRVAHEPGQPL
mmetsp:Transcript_41252/g.105493  ORF Transcript_41252/g.105493 Transcript_41252/m.105493 type:complete len:243 (+) Transcript_41252:103-831(+)